MKFPVAYYLFFIYLSVIIRPFIMIGFDMYDHAFEEAIHVATVHAKYGSNHLEIAVADTSKDGSKSQSTVKSEDITSLHVPVKHEAVLTVTDDISTACSDVLNQKAVSMFLSIVAPPPKA